MSLYISLPKNQFRYYYSNLNGEEKKVYTAFLQGVCSFAPEIAIESVCPPDRIREIYDCLFLDIPELFFLEDYFTGHMYEPTKKSPFYRYSVQPKYRYNAKETMCYLNEIRNKTAPLLNTLNRLGAYQRVELLHDYLVKTITYDEVAINQFNIIGAFLNNCCVCSGISKAFKYIADRMCIPSLVAIGDVKKSNGMFYRDEHAWIIVSLSGIFYHCDVTFDNSLSTTGSIRHDYFLLSDREIAASHSPKVQYPSCLDSYGYYKRRRVCFSSVAQAQAFIKNEIYKKRHKSIIFQLEMSRSTSEKKLKKEIQQMIQNTIFASNEYGHCQLNTNFSRSVFQISLFQ